MHDRQRRDKINPYDVKNYVLYHTTPTFKIKVSKGIGNQHYNLLRKCFLAPSETEIVLLATTGLSCANYLRLAQSTLLSLGKELTMETILWGPW